MPIVGGILRMGRRRHSGTMVMPSLTTFRPVGRASRIAADIDAFTASATVARLLELLEHQYVVVTLVRDLIDQGVTVRIGAENQLEDLRECSVVLARYTVEGQAAGTVGVLGPTRMDYPGTMATVRAVARYVSKILDEG